MSKHQLKSNTIYCGDNLKMLKEVPSESVDLIYIDPPFNSNRNYEVFWGDTQEKRAFDDRFGDAEAYIEYMRPRINELYRVLKKTGSFYYHCDWHASHYVKIMLDNLFGFNNFENEIIWKRSLGHALGSKRYDTITDSIFFYTKSKKYTFNKLFEDFDEADIIKKFPLVEKETGRRFNHQKLEKSSNAYNKDETRIIEGKKVSTTLGWIWTQETFDERIKENPHLIYWTESGRPRYKLYADEYEGKAISNLWTDILALSSNSKELRGYPTQKPLELLERIIMASSNKGDIVLDAFCGCGTTILEAQKLGRNWIGIDIAPSACREMAQRLWDILKLEEEKDFAVVDLRKDEKELRVLPHFEFQNWACIALGGIPNKRKSGDFGIDGKLYPVGIDVKKRQGNDLFGKADIYYPIQVKQVDKAGRPDIDSFETAIRRDGRNKGYFVAFDYSKDAIAEIKRLDKEGEIEIIPITVKELIKMEIS